MAAGERDDDILEFCALHFTPLYTRYPIVARALGIAAFRPSERASKGILHTIHTTISLHSVLPLHCAPIHTIISLHCTSHHCTPLYHCTALHYITALYFTHSTSHTLPRLHFTSLHFTATLHSTLLCIISLQLLIGITIRGNTVNHK